MAAAEASLQKGDLAGADTHFRAALVEGWVLRATLLDREGRSPEAREALRTASLFRVASPPALLALGTAELRMGDASAAADVLAELAAATSNDPEALRLLARALAAEGRRDEAAQQLQAAPGDGCGGPAPTAQVAAEDPRTGSAHRAVEPRRGALHTRRRRPAHPAEPGPRRPRLPRRGRVRAGPRRAAQGAGARADGPPRPLLPGHDRARGHDGARPARFGDRGVP